MKYTIGKEYEFSDNGIMWYSVFLQDSMIATFDGVLNDQSKSGNKAEWYPLIREVESNNTPIVGTTFTFDKGFEPKWVYLADQSIYGWENGDILEIVTIKVNSEGEDVYIVLNIQEDVLSTAAIVDIAGLMELKGKLIQGKAYQFDCELEERGCIGICEHTHKDGLEYIMLNTLKGSSHNTEFCTNIKLLVPEGE